MREVFRSSSAGRVGLYQSMLEDAGIRTFVRNASTQQSLVAGLVTAILPLPDFWPTLCVMNDGDYAEAMAILSTVRNPDASEMGDWKCMHCAETVPGNFTACWNCENPRDDKTER